MEIENKIKCPICDWDWKVESDDDRSHLCHQCGYDSKLGDFDEEALHQW
jgi:primosomal protein N'